MKSVAPTILTSMLSSISVCIAIASLIASVILKEGFFALIFVIFFLGGLVTLLKAHDYATDIRAWVDPAKELEFKNEIPQDAIDRQWIKEIEEAYNTNQYGFYSNDLLTEAKKQISFQNKDSKLRTLFYAAKSAKGIRLPKPVTIRSDD